VVVYDAGSENEYTIHEIEENLCYYWRVLANDLNSEGRYSTQTWNFNGPMSVVNEDEKLPEDFKISRVYPNPFNASVSVEVEINRSRDLNFRFFNSAGQTVLESKQMGLPNGEHTFSFNLKHLSSGIYFVQLESMGVSSRVEKILLIK